VHGAREGLRVVVWNLEWAPRRRRPRIRARFEELRPDLICATEADREVLPSGGHTAECEPDAGYGIRGLRRKVILWSRWPLDEADEIGSPDLPTGRFIAATVHAPPGPIRVVGVCIPWSHALVRSDGHAVWEDHLAYLRALGPLLADQDASIPLLLLGDFNQRLPRSRAPARVHKELTRALRGLCVATEGTVPVIERSVIDHLAHSPSLWVRDLEGIDRADVDGRPLSDHDGVVATVLLRGSGMARTVRQRRAASDG
jgi:endonuclease/exonuclease/phosphatase family metal-dependent hydrolase